MARLKVLSCESDADVGRDSELSDPIPLAARGEVGYPGWLSDRFGRKLRYLRLSVTDRCDLRCTYCMPEEGVPASPKEEVLTIEELARIVRVFHAIGVRTVRLTGGEPLVRRGLERLIELIRGDVGLDDIAMTTNGTALAHRARDLARAGLARVNVSLDSLRPDTFARMTRGGDVARVIAGVEAARDAGIREIKLNAVVVRGENDDQVEEIVEWAWARDITPRFIELMPLGEGARLGLGAVVPIAEVKRRLGCLLAPEAAADYRSDRGPAGYLPARDGSGRKVGFIGATTENFCSRCNRVRVTARGDVRACLASPSGLSLRDWMRSGHADARLVEVVEAALFGKDHGHEFDVAGVLRHRDVDMSRVGG